MISIPLTGRSEYGGCGPKVRMSTLVRSLEPAGIMLKSGDVGPVGETNLVMTTDTAFSFGCTGSDFGYMTMLHALGDIYSSSCIAIAATISVCISLDDEKELASIMEGVHFAAADEHLELVNAHTYYGDKTNLTPSILGRWIDIPTTQKKPGVGDLVYLSRPLGAFYSFVSSRTHPNATASVAMMRMSHRALAIACVGLHTFSSDVAGFGLAGTLINISKQSGLHVRLNLNDLEKGTVLSITEPSACRIEDNFEDFHSDVDPILTNVLPGGVLFGGEFCGPLVYAVPQHSRDDFITASNAVGFHPIEIGELVADQVGSFRLHV